MNKQQLLNTAYVKVLHKEQTEEANKTQRTDKEMTNVS